MDSVRSVPMLDLLREYEYLKDSIDRAVERCLTHQKWILGPEVKELEGEIARYLGAKHCIGVSSGTDALVLSLRALAIKMKGREYFDRNDRIITTPFTFTATGDAILRAGATPVFVDIDLRTYNVDPAAIEDYLSHHAASDEPHARVVGIIPVHLYGMACDMDAIMRIAADHRLFVLEDTAQAFGGTWQGKKLGAIGTAGAFSFFPSKNLGGFGDGGMISTDDDEIADLARMLLKHGGKDKYNVDHVGYNGRLDTIQAAVLLAKLPHIDEFNEGRRRIAESYTAGLHGMPGLVLPVDHAPCQPVQGVASEPFLPRGHVFHQYTIAVGAGKRDALQGALAANEVSSMVYYPFPLHKMKVFKDGAAICASKLSCAEEACATVLSLPIEPLFTADETVYVVEAVRTFFAKG